MHRCWLRSGITSTRRCFHSSIFRAQGYPRSKLPFTLKEGPEEISLVGFGDALRPGASLKEFTGQFERFLRNGGNFVQLVSGAEQAISQTMELSIMQGKTNRGDLLVCASYPRYLDPMLAAAPPDLPGSIYYTPDAYMDPLNQIAADEPPEVPPEQELLESEHPLVVTKFEEFFGKTLKIMGTSGVDVILIDVDLLVQDMAEDGYRPDEFDSVLKALFQLLEGKVQAEELSAYGISSSYFGRPRSCPSHVDLEALVAIARTVKAEHALRFVCGSLCVNQGELAYEANCSGGVTTLQFAQASNMCVLAKGSLDSRDAEGVDMRLQSFPGADAKKLQSDLRTAMDHVRQFEKVYPGIVEHSKLSKREQVAAENVAWGQILAQQGQLARSLPLWERVLHHRIMPSLHVTTNKLIRMDIFQEWALGYKKVTSRMFDTMTAAAHQAAAGRSEALEKVLDTSPTLAKWEAPLEQKSLMVAMSSGVDCVLVGQLGVVESVLTPATKLPGVEDLPPSKQETHDLLVHCATAHPAQRASI